MKFYRILIVLTAVLFTLSMQVSMAKDKSYKFNYRLEADEKITDAKDLEMLKAAEYSLKKRCIYFSIKNSRTYDKNASQKTTRFDHVRLKKPQMRTELIINCFDQNPGLENVYNAQEIKSSIDAKYAD
ncbi:MAG: hypothetical protein H6912_04950 [Kordiimonadaceae bacterium]|nr:hypothetical protein [Kordiimonadaceae bacterium]